MQDRLFFIYLGINMGILSKYKDAGKKRIFTLKSKKSYGNIEKKMLLGLTSQIVAFPV